MGTLKLKNVFRGVKFWLWKIRAADAKEVGVGNSAEETCCYPNKINVTFQQRFVNPLNREANNRYFHPILNLQALRNVIISYSLPWSN
jgi:hypothetical protein